MIDFKIGQNRYKFTYLFSFLYNLDIVSDATREDIEIRKEVLERTWRSQGYFKMDGNHNWALIVDLRQRAKLQYFILKLNSYTTNLGR